MGGSKAFWSLRLNGDTTCLRFDCGLALTFADVILREEILTYSSSSPLKISSAAKLIAGNSADCALSLTVIGFSAL